MSLSKKCLTLLGLVVIMQAALSSVVFAQDMPIYLPEPPEEIPRQIIVNPVPDTITIPEINPPDEINLSNNSIIRRDNPITSPIIIVQSENQQKYKSNPSSQVVYMDEPLTITMKEQPKQATQRSEIIFKKFPVTSVLKEKQPKKKENAKPVVVQEAHSSPPVKPIKPEMQPKIQERPSSPQPSTAQHQSTNQPNEHSKKEPQKSFVRRILSWFSR